MKKKAGLFFGSFNPIHIGHLIIAEYMLEFTDLDELWFVVSPHNPLKDKKTLLADNHRLTLVRIATEDNPKLKVSDIEFKMPQPSYTSKTLAYLSEKYPTKQFVLLMGSDNLNTFTKWKNYEYIIDNYEIYVFPRKGSMNIPVTLKKTKITDAPLLEISSTFIRKAIKDKKEVRYFLPVKVYEYIREMHFYEK
jgi:nicotinate-nucleotide adenylyltransferase